GGEMLKVVLIDDERMALDALTDLLAEHKQVEVVGCYTKPMEVMEKCCLTEVDVVFLDIEMPGLNGIDTAIKLLEQNDRLLIVFVSAYMNYMTEVSHVPYTDFLLKPVSKRQMAQTIKKLTMM